MIHHPGQSRTKPGTQRDVITHQTSLPVGINQLQSSMAFWETCFGSNKSLGVTAECNPFLWHQCGLYLTCTLSCVKDGLKAEKRGAERVWKRAGAPRQRLLFEEEKREVFPTSAYEFFFFTPSHRRGLLPEQAGVMESHAASLCSSWGSLRWIKPRRQFGLDFRPERCFSCPVSSVASPMLMWQ